MWKPFVICGIDASLSSTGLCFSECLFNEDSGDRLLDLLLNLQPKSDNVLTPDFTVIHEEEVKCPKELEKQLAKVRKNQREAIKRNEHPSIEDTCLEEWLFVKKIENILENSLDRIHKFKPDVIIVEDYSYHSQGSTTQLAELKGAMKISLRVSTWSKPYPYFYTAPIPSVKKIASTKGNATKGLICENMQRYGFTGYEGMDDQLDAIAVALSLFYAIYYRLFGFNFPEGKNAKEKNSIKSWIKCLETFANRIGTKDELKRWVNI